MGGHFSQGVSPAGVAGDADGVVICLNFIFQLLLLPHFLTDGGLQQAVWGDGAVPEEPVEVGIHREEHRLENMPDHRLQSLFLISALPFNILHNSSVGILFERLCDTMPNAKQNIGGREQKS